MADSDPVVEINATPSLIEQLGKAFVELETHKEALEDEVLWKEMEEHFRHLETMMMKKQLELEVKEKAFKEEEFDFSSVLAEREAAVAAKEQDMFDQIQELKDAAVATIAVLRANHEPESLEPMDVGDNKESKVNSSLGDTNAPLTDPEEEYPDKTGENDGGVIGEVKPRPELTQLCEQMDAKGLLSFTLENKIKMPTICEQLSIALESATQPGRLVLASLEGFYPPDVTTQEGDKKDAALQGMRQSCLLFLESMATLLARADTGADNLLNPEIKQQAKAISDEWKPKLADADINAANGKSLEVEAFLQLLATFRIASEFDEEELCKLVLAVTQHRQAPELCRSLGLTHKMPGVVEALINGGKQIDAVHFIHAFQLTESFPPVPLLKTYLKDLRRNSQGKGANSANAAGGTNDANAQELAALRSVIQCVKEYKLEADYPLDPLLRRLAQLEKSKPDKKRFGEPAKHQQFKKQQRSNGGFHGFRGPHVAAPAAGRQAPAVLRERAYGGISERYPHAAPSAYNYQAPSQTYTQQGYGERSYFYPQDERVSSTTYNPAPSSYGSYLSGEMQSHQSYM